MGELSELEKKMYSFYEEVNQLKGDICIDCLEKQFDTYVGDRKLYDNWMMANTMRLSECDRCGTKDVGILPFRDIIRAVKASNGKPVLWF